LGTSAGIPSKDDSIIVDSSGASAEGPGITKEVWHFLHRAFRPAIPSGALSFAWQFGQATSTGIGEIPDATERCHEELVKAAVKLHDDPARSNDEGAINPLPARILDDRCAGGPGRVD
jgi:hypothetical protein